MSDNVRNVQLALFRILRNSCQIIVPNYTPHRWYESDLWAVTDSGYAREFEIKLSVSDLRADSKKANRYLERVDGRWTWQEPGTKHARLGAGDERGPCQFWFVGPTDVLSAVELPAWAGRIEVQLAPYCHLLARKDGPRLHSAKVSPSVLAHANRACYWRFWNERIALGGERPDIARRPT